jgi:hypothetical protein
LKHISGLSPLRRLGVLAAVSSCAFTACAVDALDPSDDADGYSDDAIGESGQELWLAPLVLRDTCTMRTADESVVASATSDDYWYTGTDWRCANRFVADFSEGTSGLMDIEVGDVSPEDCSSVQINFKFYDNQGSNGTWRRVGYGSAHPHWEDPDAPSGGAGAGAGGGPGYRQPGGAGGGPDGTEARCRFGWPLSGDNDGRKIRSAVRARLFDSSGDFVEYKPLTVTRYD